MKDDEKKSLEKILKDVPEEHRNRGLAAGVGATIGAVIGSVVGGPIGAAVGASIGGAAGVLVDEENRKTPT